GGGGAGRMTGRGAGGANTPKTPVPAMIWLKTAKAPSPSAASVEGPANAAPGMSNATKSARIVSFFMSVPPEGANFFAFPSGSLDGPYRPSISGAWSAPGGGLASGDVEHRGVQAEHALADRLQHAIDGRRHQGAGPEIAKRALGGKFLVGAATAHDLNDLR